MLKEFQLKLLTLAEVKVRRGTSGNVSQRKGTSKQSFKDKQKLARPKKKEEGRNIYLGEVYAFPKTTE